MTFRERVSPLSALADSARLVARRASFEPFSRARRRGCSKHSSVRRVASRRVLLVVLIRVETTISFEKRPV
jgi:hypothetical protein|tara:strand:+ start:28788 stop:29000 length:213 start_codon:yes stop_codon:yes gene_type:complete